MLEGFGPHCPSSKHRAQRFLLKIVRLSGLLFVDEDLLYLQDDCYI
jgi:hypothetical protein